MKNTTTILAAVPLFFANLAMAQDGELDNRGKVSLGLKAGMNYSNVYDAQAEDFRADSKTGYVFGAQLSIPLNQFVAIQPEALFAQKGFKGEGTLLGAGYELTRTTNYLDIPLQLAVKPSEFITILAGPQFSYLLRQKDVFSSTSISYTQEQEFKNDNIRKNIFGFTGGLDINLRHLVLGGRVGWDIVNNRGDGTSNTPRYKNAWFQATIGYMLY